ncbi:MAG: DUF4114 domain-containing protein [Candidatus Hydrogenedentes bacterium]|nr:DUF4114 domain-containing protein [Candidatus Hydrogenedentota bacterium]
MWVRDLWDWATSSRWRQAVLATAVAVVLVLVVLLPWGGLEQSPYQAERRPFDLFSAGPVMKAGSDWKSFWFRHALLPRMAGLASEKFNAKAIATNFADVVLNPARLTLEEECNVRVYFVGEASGYLNALGINLEGNGIKAGNPKLVFPRAETRVDLYRSSGNFFLRLWTRLQLAFWNARSADMPLFPGDFVDLGTLPAGTRLSFFLVADNHSGDVRVYTPIASENPDGIPHMVAVAIEDTPFLMLSFEDMFEGGDRDYSDCVFAVQLSGYNVQALLGRIDPWYQVKRILRIVVPLLVVTLGPLFLLAVRRYIRRKRANRAYAEARQLLATGAHDKAASQVLRGRRFEPSRKAQERWDLLELAVRRPMADGYGLLTLFSERPDCFRHDETASLIAARAQVEAGLREDFDRLHELWRTESRAPAQWVNLEADLLAHQGRPGDAGTLLERAKDIAGRDPGRLARLAWLGHRDYPEQAAALLAQAEAQAPEDPDVRLCRARILEERGEFAAAENAYRNALEAAPRDPILRDHVAEFYRRRGDHAQALRLWCDTLASPTLDSIWLKALFWSRVALPVDVAWKTFEVPAGRTKPLIEFLLRLPPGRFWKEDEFDAVAQSNPDFLSRQEVVWLRVLEYLRTGQENAALAILNVARFGRNAWHEDLEMCLLQILTYRRVGFTNPALRTETSPANRHPFFQQLDVFVQGTCEDGSPSITRILDSPNVFVQVFDAAGWKEAARCLHPDAAPPAAAPVKVS